MNPVLIGGALGALAMYFLDADSGRRRRARTRDRVQSAARRLGEASRVTARDTVHRAYGIVAGTKRLFDATPVPDDVLVGRVRSALGRVVSHPHAIEVAATNGHVELKGPILEQEVRALIRCVRHVPGVRGLDDRLTVYREPAHVSALQGGVPRHGARFELLQDNWAPAARLLVGALGAGMLLSAARTRGSRGGVVGLAGAALLARATANRSFESLLGFADPDHGIVVQKVIHVNAPVERVFAFWTDYQNFPRFMHYVKEVRVVEDPSRKRESISHWVVAGPAGVPVEWTAEVSRVIANHLIEWRSTEDSPMRHKGTVRFQREPDGGTRLSVHLSYMPPAGAFGHAVASLFGADPKSEMDADLMRMKTMIETGHAPHDAARRLGAPRES